MAATLPKQGPNPPCATPQARETQNGEPLVDENRPVPRTASLAEIQSFVRRLVGRLARDCWLIGDAVNVAEQTYGSDSKQWVKRQIEICYPLPYSTIRKFAKLAADYALDDVPSDMTLNAFLTAVNPQTKRRGGPKQGETVGHVGPDGVPGIGKAEPVGDVPDGPTLDLPPADPLTIARLTLPRSLAMVELNLGKVLAGRKADRIKLWRELVEEERNQLVHLATQCHERLGQLQEELAAASTGSRQKARVVRIAPAIE